MIRTLIVDDSPTLRVLTRAVLESDPELSVVGEARNGEEAVALCLELEPDVVIMDIRMPRMNGFEAISRIMALSPRPILVLTSTASEIELGTSWRALEVGAMMVLRKPSGLPGECLKAGQLIAAVKIAAGVKVVHRPLKTAERPPRLTAAPAWKGPVELVAVGASTGGPAALQVILKELSADLPAPVVVVQHLSAGFVAGLARWLSETTPMPVKVAAERERMRPGTVYLAPDDRHLLIEKKGLIYLGDSPLVDGHRPSVTALFTSAAEVYGPAAVGVLLTGMGGDGAWGLKTLRGAGAHTIAQDEQSSVVYGMPQKAVSLDAAEVVLPLQEIGGHLRLLVKSKGDMNGSSADR